MRISDHHNTLFLYFVRLAVANPSPSLFLPFCHVHPYHHKTRVSYSQLSTNQGEYRTAAKGSYVTCNTVIFSLKWYKTITRNSWRWDNGYIYLHTYLSTWWHAHPSRPTMWYTCMAINHRVGNVIVLWKEEVSLPSNGKMPWFDRVMWVSGSSALLFLMQSFCKNEGRDYKATSCLQNRKFGDCCSSR